MQQNDFVRMTYSGKLKDTNQVFDQGEDVPIVVGVEYVMKGVDEALLDMNVGDKRTIEIAPQKGFGNRDPDLVKMMPLSEFKKHGQDPRPGMIFEADQYRGRVLSVSGGRVQVDFNHPLAGKILIYDLEINAKIENPEEKVKAMVEYYARTKVEKAEIKINDKEVEIIIPPILNVLYRKKVADDCMRFLGLEKVKFAEVFEKPKEQQL